MTTIKHELKESETHYYEPTRSVVEYLNRELQNLEPTKSKLVLRGRDESLDARKRRRVQLPKINEIRLIECFKALLI